MIVLKLVSPRLQAIGETIPVPKNPYRGKLCVCEKCFRTYRDEGQPEEKIVDGDKILSEFIPLCPRCFQKSLHAERQRQLILGAIGDGIITEEDYKKFKRKEMSHKEFKEKISYGNRKLKRKNALADMLIKCEELVFNKKFKRDASKYKLVEKEIIALANAKMRKIMEDEGEEFLD